MTSSLDRLRVDDLIISVTNMPVMTKAEAIRFLRSGRMKIRRYEMSDIRPRIHGDAAVVTTRLQRTHDLNDPEVSDDWRFAQDTYGMLEGGKSSHGMLRQMLNNT